MKSLSILLKPASGRCNLNCAYCFYHTLARKRKIPDLGIMGLDTLENIVRKALDFAGQSCSFGFQGGEPTLAGIDFYKKFITFTDKYNSRHITINKALQTNGTLIDDSWAGFLADNNFLVGLSIDGTEELHNKYRKDCHGNGTFDKVVRAAELFDKYHVQYNILMVVTADSGREAKAIYKFFKIKGFRYLQFIPCLGPSGAARGREDYSLTTEKYEKFLIKFFDCWLEDISRNEYTSVRFFDNIFNILRGGEPEACDMKGHCSVHNVIEANGDVYPCDFYVADEMKAGNINELNFSEIFNSSITQNFIRRSFTEHESCMRCKWHLLCRNGCFRHRIDNLNYYCQAYKNFFSYSIPRWPK